MDVVPLIVGVGLLALVVRLIAGMMDHDRIRRYVATHGGQTESVHWHPFGTGWFGERGDRIYAVRYVDAVGNRRKAHCKTSWLSGVYFTRDEVVRPASRTPPRPSPAIRRATEQQAGRSSDAKGGESVDLEAENRRLRDELARLRHRERGNGFADDQDDPG